MVRVFQTSNSASSDGDVSFNMDELKRRIADDTNPFPQKFPIAQRTTEILHIIAFDNTAGVHSVEYPKGSGCNIILAFESLSACEEFASRLRAQHFFDPQPQAILVDTLHAFCEKVGVHMQIVPHGVDLIPPVQNVELVGRHNRSLRQQQKHLEYVFSMMDEQEEDGVVPEAAAFQ